MKILVQWFHEKILAEHFWFVLLLLMSFSFIVAVFLRREVLIYVCWVDGTSDDIVQTLLVQGQAWSTAVRVCNKERLQVTQTDVPRPCTYEPTKQLAFD